MRASILVGLVLTLAPLKAWTADVCTVDGLKLCDAFQSTQAKIPYANGTFIPNLNFFRMPAYNAAEVAGANRQTDAMIADQFTALHVNASAALSAVRPALSAEFIYHFSEHLDELAEVLSGEGFQFQIPWPPGGPSKTQEVSVDEVKSQFLTMLTPEQKQTLLDFTKSWRTLDRRTKNRTDDIFTSSGQQLLRDMRTVTPERRQQVAALVDFAKQAIVKTIRAGKTDDQLSPEQQNAIAKVQSVQLNLSQAQVDSKTDCIGYIPNAFYSARTNKINICSDVMNFPDASLIAVLGHEIGHSIDICGAQSGVYSVDQPLLNRLFKSRAVESDNSRFHAVRNLQALTGATSGNPGVSVTAENLDFSLSSNEIAFLRDQGVLKTTVSGTPFGNYVFRDVYSCLTKPVGGGFKSQSATDRAKLVSDVLDARSILEGPGYDRAADGARVKAAIDAAPECESSGAKTQMSETMADWIGTSVQAQYLKQNPVALSTPPTASERLGLIGVNATFACYQRLRPQREAATNNTMVIGRIRATQSQLDNDPHPFDVKRLDDLILRDPDLQSQLGCQSPSNSAARACTVGGGSGPAKTASGSANKNRDQSAGSQ